MPLLDEVSDSFGVEPEVVLADALLQSGGPCGAGGARHRSWHLGAGRASGHTRSATHRMGEKLARAKGKAHRQPQVSEGPNGCASRRCWGSSRLQAAGRMALGVLAEHQASGGDLMRAVRRRGSRSAFEGSDSWAHKWEVGYRGFPPPSPPSSAKLVTHQALQVHLLAGLEVSVLGAGAGAGLGDARQCRFRGDHPRHRAPHQSAGIVHISHPPEDIARF